MTLLPPPTVSSQIKDLQLQSHLYDACCGVVEGHASFRPCCYARTTVVICVVCRHGSIYIVGGNIVFCNNLFSQASTGKMVGLSRCRWRWGKVGLTGPSHLNCFSWLLLDRTFLSGLTLLAHCEPT